MRCNLALCCVIDSAAVGNFVLSNSSNSRAPEIIDRCFVFQFAFDLTCDALTIDANYSSISPPGVPVRYIPP